MNAFDSLSAFSSTHYNIIGYAMFGPTFYVFIHYLHICYHLGVTIVP